MSLAGPSVSQPLPSCDARLVHTRPRRHHHLLRLEMTHVAQLVTDAVFTPKKDKNPKKTRRPRRNPFTTRIHDLRTCTRAPTPDAP